MKKPTTNHNSLLIKALGDRPIAFSPMVAELGGSASAGIFMCQLLYWKDKGFKKDLVYKTIADFKKETCLTRSEQECAIRKWKALGVLEVTRRGIPGVRHFRIDIEKLVGLLDSRNDARQEQDEAGNVAESAKLNCKTEQRN